MTKKNENNRDGSQITDKKNLCVADSGSKTCFSLQGASLMGGNRPAVTIEGRRSHTPLTIEGV